MIYAVTLTASPHKDKFKKLSWAKQEQKFIEFFERFKCMFTDFRYVFETCPTSGMRHVHLCVSPMQDNVYLTAGEIMEVVFYDYFIYEFGYHGNPPSHFVYIDSLENYSNFDRWEDYMYKTLNPIRILGN